MSDLLFFKSVKNLKISKTEMKFLELGSYQIWAGLVLTIFSAFSFWIFFPAVAQAPKILAKTTIFLVILVNGIFLNLWVTPFLKKHLEVNLAESQSFRKARTILFSSGAVSILSWYYVLVLGAWRNLEASYRVLIGMYLALLLVAVVCSNFIGRYKLRKR